MKKDNNNPEEQILKTIPSNLRDRKIEYKAGEVVEVEVLKNSFQAVVVDDYNSSTWKKDFSIFIAIAYINNGQYIEESIRAAFMKPVYEGANP
jgi:hypothetical protein